MLFFHSCVTSSCNKFHNKYFVLIFPCIFYSEFHLNLNIYLILSTNVIERLSHSPDTHVPINNSKSIHSKWKINIILFVRKWQSCLLTCISVFKIQKVLLCIYYYYYSSTAPKSYIMLTKHQRLFSLAAYWRTI